MKRKKQKCWPIFKVFPLLYSLYKKFATKLIKTDQWFFSSVCANRQTGRPPTDRGKQ